MEIYFWDFRNLDIPKGIELDKGYNYYELYSYVVSEFLRMCDYVSLKYNLKIGDKVIKNNKLRIIKDITYLAGSPYIILEDNNDDNELYYNKINDIISIEKYRNEIINNILI